MGYSPTLLIAWQQMLPAERSPATLALLLRAPAGVWLFGRSPNALDEIIRGHVWTVRTENRAFSRPGELTFAAVILFLDQSELRGQAHGDIRQHRPARHLRVFDQQRLALGTVDRIVESAVFGIPIHEQLFAVFELIRRHLQSHRGFRSRNKPQPFEVGIIMDFGRNSSLGEARLNRLRHASILEQCHRYPVHKITSSSAGKLQPITDGAGAPATSSPRQATVSFTRALKTKRKMPKGAACSLPELLRDPILSLATARSQARGHKRKGISMADRHFAASKDKLLTDLRAVMADSETLLKEIAGELGERGKDARERLKASLESAKESYGDLQEKAQAGVEAADAMVREHPYAAVGIAFGVGLVVGVLVARK
jgi:ElaB/YqjD/DUF883 family membrane-anchored ribosome-binding protein